MMQACRSRGAACAMALLNILTTLQGGRLGGQGPQPTARGHTRVVTWHPQILANQLLNLISTRGLIMATILLHGTSRFSDSPTALIGSTYLFTIYMLTYI